ncbi:hypothetical protein ACH3XW_35860 [Acanthocheilonema viteae]
MRRTCRQTELIRGAERKIRGTRRLTKATRVRNSHAVHRKAACREVSPEIRSVREGRIRLGSVAPLLSRRAKTLAMNGYYNYYSDDEEDDVSDNSDEDNFTEDEYDDDGDHDHDDDNDELYDNDHHHHHRSCDRHRTPIHVKKHYEEYEDELFPPPSSSSSSYPISASQLLRTRRQPKSYRTHKSAIKTSVATKSAPTKAVSGVKLKKSTARRNPKNKNKKVKAAFRASRYGPITRSRGRAPMNNG